MTYRMGGIEGSSTSTGVSLRRTNACAKRTQIRVSFSTERGWLCSSYLPLSPEYRGEGVSLTRIACVKRTQFPPGSAQILATPKVISCAKRTHFVGTRDPLRPLKNKSGVEVLASTPLVGFELKIRKPTSRPTPPSRVACAPRLQPAASSTLRSTDASNCRLRF